MRGVGRQPRALVGGEVLGGPRVAFSCPGGSRHGGQRRRDHPPCRLLKIRFKPKNNISFTIFPSNNFKFRDALEIWSSALRWSSEEKERVGFACGTPVFFFRRRGPGKGVPPPALLRPWGSWSLSRSCRAWRGGPPGRCPRIQLLPPPRNGFSPSSPSGSFMRSMNSRFAFSCASPSSSSTAGPRS